MPFLRQSTSQIVRFGPCLDKTDGVTEETALTLAQADMRLSKDGAAFAQKGTSGNATHDSDGWYSTTLSTTDTNTVGELILNVHQPANMLPVWMRFWVLEEVIYDALFGASAAGFDASGRVDVGSWLGTAAATPTTAGVPEVDVTHLGGAAQSATDLKDFADAGYDPATNKVEGVKLADTTTTNTDMLTADAVWDEALSGHTSTGSVGRALQLGGVVLAETTATGTPTTTTLPLTAGSTVDDFYNDLQIIPVSGALVGQSRIITDYTGSTKTITVDEPWTSAISSGDAVVIRAFHSHSLQQLVDAVWDEDVDTTHQTAGTAGKKLDDAGGAADPWATALPGAYGAGTAGKIVGDNINAPLDTIDTVVDGIQTDLSNGTDGLGAIKADTAAILTDTGTTLDTIVDSILVDTGTTIPALIATAQADLDTITGADGVNLLSATQASIDAIETDTSTTLQAELDGIQADTEDIQSRLPAALVSGLMSSDITAISTSTTAADNLEKSTLQIIPGAAEGTPSTTVIQTDLAETQDDIYIGRTMIFTSGAAKDEATDITDYVGSTGTVTVTALANAPSAADTFIIV